MIWSCPVCRGDMRWIDGVFTCTICGYEEPPVPKKPQTNADRIRGMSDEELAEKINIIRSYCANDACGYPCPLRSFCYWVDEEPMDILTWLKSPAEKDGET